MVTKQPRPEATGNPLDMSTSPTVPKARAAILSAQVGGRLTGQDRKLFNFLLAVAYPDMLTQSVHKVLMADARGFLGSHESNDQVRASLRRLASVMLDFDYTTEDGEERWAVGGLLSASGPKGEGIIRYQFGVDVAPILAEPAVFARLKLAVIGQFVSKYAGMMYELLELRANMDNPTWTIGIDDLRALLGVVDKMKNFKDFRYTVLTPAISEINEKADISVTMTDTRRGRKVESLTFTIAKKDFRNAMEAELQHKGIRKSGAAARIKRDEDGTKRDPDTVDMIDRRTGRERGGWPPLLKSETIDHVREIAAGWDVGVLERTWYEWQQGKEAPRDPDKAFVGWVKGYVKNRRLS